MHHHTRREFLWQTWVGSTLVCSIVEGWRDLLRAQDPPAPRYDLPVKGGRVIDPYQVLSAERDIPISAPNIAHVPSAIPEYKSRHASNPSRKIVTPGVIDLHT